MSIVQDVIGILTDWVTGFMGIIIDGIKEITNLFYVVDDNGTGTFTVLGVLALMGLAIGLVRFAVRFIQRFFIK